MAVRGIYSEQEKRILANFKKEAKSREGYPKPTERGLSVYGMAVTHTVTSEAIIRYGSFNDPWNSFYTSESHAVASKWGGLIAHPWFLEIYKPEEHMLRTEKGLFLTFYLCGIDIECFQPIRPGDTIRSWGRCPTIEDATDLGGKGPRSFRYIDIWADLINHRDEIVGSWKQLIWVTLHEGRPPVEKWMDDYGYTQKELKYLAEIFEGEKPRGAQIRYWEDVEVGDEAQPVTTGIAVTEGMGGRPPDSNKAFPGYIEPLGGPIGSGYVPDPQTGLLYPVQGGRHFNDRTAQFEGASRAWLFNGITRAAITRVVTNWMGNDAFLCKHSWRHVFRTPNGDALIAKAKVVKKYEDNGEHMVDLKAWVLDLRGNITDMAISTVKLISKEDEYPFTRRVIKR